MHRCIESSCQAQSRLFRCDIVWRLKFQVVLQVAEEYRLVPDTLYLTINYIDRYLSGNVMNRQRLQLLGVACMMIAA